MDHQWLVEHGFKWSPVKVYRRSFPRGTDGDHWRVVVSAEDRKGEVNPHPTQLALIVTIRDPDRQLSVYDEVVARMAQSGWITQDLRVSDRVRARVRR
jgi:serine protease AprX